ncbi:MAG: beta-ribofuranosylaminobenzene 5'-phosphate synthase family protein, partial [Patescibacteria group bacterium]
MLKKVIITTAGRLHFNSLKMNMLDGRGCGGIGVALTEPILKIIFSPSDSIIVTGADIKLRKKVKNFAKNTLSYIGSNRGVNIKIVNFFSGKVGLGSGTQLGMSVGRGICSLYEKKVSLPLIAKITGRAGVSGIGYYSFSRGGLIVDGGYRMGEKEAKKNFVDHSPSPPPLTAHYSFPNKWKILLLSPKKALPKISNLNEDKLFAENTPVSTDDVGSICTNVLMGIIPSLLEKDYFNFVEYL